MKKLILLSLLLLTACSTCPTPVISTNNLTQTDYEYNCLDENKTFSQIIICYKAQDKSEKAQNKITNDYLKTK